MVAFREWVTRHGNGSTHRQVVEGADRYLYAVGLRPEWPPSNFVGGCSRRGAAPRTRPLPLTIEDGSATFMTNNPGVRPRRREISLAA